MNLIMMKGANLLGILTRP